MALVLDPTVGGVAANSYCSLAVARAFYEANIYATDANLAIDTKLTQALVMATTLLDEHFEWFGYVASSTQRLLWPRSAGYIESVGGVLAGGVDNLNGYPIDPTTIPDKIKEATAEYARQLLLSDRTADSDLETNDIKHVKAGSVELTFGNPGAKPVPDAVFAKVQHLGRLRNTRGVARTVRV